MMKRFLSAFLTLVMLAGAMTVPTAAAWEDKVDEDGNPLIDYKTEVYANPEQKLADTVAAAEEKVAAAQQAAVLAPKLGLCGGLLAAILLWPAG